MQRVWLKTADSPQPFEVVLERDNAGAPDEYTAHLTDQSLSVVVAVTGPDRGFLRHGGRVLVYQLLRRKNQVEVWLNGKTYFLELVERTARRAGGSETPAPPSDITAAMPGTILKIEVGAGDEFQPHQPLVIMESMKMEMTLSAPRAGWVKQVVCHVGQLVEMGALLIQVEPTEE